MKRRFYFATFIIVLLTTSLAAQAGVIFQNYTNSTLTVIYKYCQFGAQQNCGSAYTSGPIAPNNVYQVPTVAADYVSAYMANTADGWSYISNTPSQGSCTILPFSSDILFANFSKSLLPEILQCQQAAR